MDYLKIATATNSLSAASLENQWKFTNHSKHIEINKAGTMATTTEDERGYV